MRAILARVLRIDAPIDRRIIAISDIHGNYNRLVRLLEKVAYTADDLLVIVGDMIEKGRESLKTLRYLIELSKKNDVYMLCGNNDYIFELILNGDNSDIYSYMNERRTRSILHDMLSELSIEFNENLCFSSVRERILAHFSELFEWYKNLPAIIEVGEFIFSHSGLISNDIYNQDFYMTIRNNDFFIDNSCFEKWVVVGHMPTVNLCYEIGSQNPIIDENRHVIFIDGGNQIKPEGQLNAFVIENQTAFSFESVDDLKPLIAISGQEESSKSVNLGWYNGEIELLEKGEDFSLIRHIETQTELYVNSDYLWNDAGVHKCCNVTNYRLKVEKGACLFYIRDFIEDCLVKKDGVVGLVSQSVLDL